MEINKEEIKQLKLLKRKEYNKNYSKNKYKSDTNFKAKEVLRGIIKRKYENNEVKQMIDDVSNESDETKFKKMVYDIKLKIFENKNAFLLS
jgi:hypothetical protein